MGLVKKNIRQGSTLSRFWRYKWSGPIVFAPIIILALIGYVNMIESQEFFSPWSCETLIDYIMNDKVPDEYPLHDQLTEAEHLKLHIIIKECQDLERYTQPVEPEGLGDGFKGMNQNFEYP